MMRTLSVTAVLVALSGCSSPSPAVIDGGAEDAALADAGSDVGAPPADAGTGTITIGPAERPARLVAPSDPGTSPAPLLVLLHGYGASAAIEDSYLGVTRAASTRGLWVLLPDGLVDAGGSRYWQGTPGCCDFAHTGVDDVAYLTGLVHEAIVTRNIDPARVYFFGHSNGGFMTYRVACELASETAAVAVLAGSDFAADTDCVPSRPVSVLHLHGTADATIPYGGGSIGLEAFPGAVEVVTRWAARAGCDPTPTTDAVIDMEGVLAGPETTPTTYTGCDPGLDVRLLSITGGAHIPAFATNAIATQVLDWLLAHSL